MRVADGDVCVAGSARVRDGGDERRSKHRVSRPRGGNVLKDRENERANGPDWTWPGLDLDLVGLVWLGAVSVR